MAVERVRVGVAGGCIEVHRVVSLANPGLARCHGRTVARRCPFHSILSYMMCDISVKYDMYDISTKDMITDISCVQAYTHA